jgi:hypothetical protein
MLLAAIATAAGPQVYCFCLLGRRPIYDNPSGPTD